MARSEFAGVTARMRQFSCVMNCISISLIWNSMSAGWSPTGTLVRPGKSTRVRLSTELQEKKRSIHRVRDIHMNHVAMSDNNFL